MPEVCARVSIPGDPEAIQAAARGLDRAGEEILADVGLARDHALADWSAPSAGEFRAYVSRALSFETEMVAAEREAARIWDTYADELRAAQQALEQATEREQAAERAEDRAREDSPRDNAAEAAGRDARDDQLQAGRDAAAAAERAAVAMERVIDGLPEARAVPGRAGGPAGDGGFKLDVPPTVPLDAFYGGARASEEWYKRQRANVSRNALRPATHAARFNVDDEYKGASHRSAVRRVSQARSTTRTIGRFARPLGPIGMGADFVGNVAQGRGALESGARMAVSAATTTAVVAASAGACGAISFGLLAAACGGAAAAGGSFLGSEVGDLIFGED